MGLKQRVVDLLANKKEECHHQWTVNPSMRYSVSPPQIEYQCCQCGSYKVVDVKYTDTGWH